MTTPSRQQVSLRIAFGLVVLAILAVIVLRVTGTAAAPLWLGPTRGRWAIRLLTGGLIMLAIAAVDWQIDRTARRSRARALGRDA